MITGNSSTLALSQQSLLRLEWMYLLLVLHCTSGEANVDSAEFIYSRRDLKATRKCQYCHKLVVGNWNITLLTGKDHELVKEAKLLRPTVIFAACCWHVFD